MTHQNITLMSFVSKTESEQLKGIFTALGYSTNITTDYHSLHSEFSGEVNNILVLFVSDVNISNDPIGRLIENPSNGPVLVIVTCDDNDLYNTVVCSYFECIKWPCSKDNLSLRLQSLSTIVTQKNELCNIFISKECKELNMVGRSKPFLNVLSQIKKIAKCDAPTVIEGETGTGKEIAAKAIHSLSERKDNPFIPVNCGALPDTLFEDEFFGHERGAFTDAKSSRLGFVAQAEGGTLFLDEIDALTPKAQVALLRFLQDHTYRPLGSNHLCNANVRILAATNSNLGRLCEEGMFRQDLYFRLYIFTLNIPTLRQRIDDIPILASYFIQRFDIRYNLGNKFICKDTLVSLRQKKWPGNIREFENTLHREYLMSDGLEIKFHDASSKQPEKNGRRVHMIGDRRYNFSFADSFSMAKAQVVDNFEFRYLTWLMAETRGNVSLAAQRACKDRRAFSRLLRKHGIDRKQFILPGAEAGQ